MSSVRRHSWAERPQRLTRTRRGVTPKSHQPRVLWRQRGGDLIPQRCRRSSSVWKNSRIWRTSCGRSCSVCAGHTRARYTSGETCRCRTSSRCCSSTGYTLIRRISPIRRGIGLCCPRDTPRCACTSRCPSVDSSITTTSSRRTASWTARTGCIRARFSCLGWSARPVHSATDSRSRWGWRWPLVGVARAIVSSAC